LPWPIHKIPADETIGPIRFSEGRGDAGTILKVVPPEFNSGVLERYDEHNHIEAPLIDP